MQLTVLAVVDSSVGQNARKLLAAELVTGQSVWEELLKQRAGTLTLAASVLAQDYGFRAAVNSNDTDTLRSALANKPRRRSFSAAAVCRRALRAPLISRALRRVRLSVAS